MIVPHQATARVLKRIAEVLNIPFSRIQTNLESYANTAGATVPLLLDQVGAGYFTLAIYSCWCRSARAGLGAQAYIDGKFRF